MSSFLQDVRIAIRGYLAKPLFTIVVLFILGLAIGANSAIFSVVTRSCCGRSSSRTRRRSSTCRNAIA